MQEVTVTLSVITISLARYSLCLQWYTALIMALSSSTLMWLLLSSDDYSTDIT